MAFSHLNRVLLVAFIRMPVTLAEDSVEIDCPESIISNVEPDPGQIILLIMGVVASIPVMAIGLFFAFFGGNVKTVLIALQAFAMIGIPLLLPIVFEMMATMESFADFTPVMFTGLTAGFVSASNAMKVVLGAKPKTKTQIIGFNTGLLLSGFFMGFWLPSLAEADVEEQQYNWVVLAGALFPGIAVASVATAPAMTSPVTSCSFGLIGGFLFIGPLSAWIGGGNVGLLSLAAGTMGACDTGGWVSMSLLGAVISGGVAVSERKMAPPGLIKNAFKLV
mmetsp:Transcript_54255/g.101330  ORF Transcript_54255/g.101330 Transcript_54255/m.101330 type:complete len:278 (+) Transcript_54255:112-945(+)